jgi:nucleotide-binding universal stress UspA family protein
MKLLYLIANQPVLPSVAAFVAKVARQTNSSVHVLAAAVDSEHMQEIEEEWTGIEEIFSDLNFSVEKVEGKILDIVKAELKRESYDIMLMGVHRRRKLFPSDFRLLTNKIFRICDIPIMLVRKTSDRFERMLVCTSGLESAERVVDLSAKLAGPAKLQATLLNVAGAVPSMYTGLNEMDETIEELLVTDTPLAQHLRRSAELLAESDIKAVVEIRHGNVVEVILEEAVEGKYDLIVLGESGARKLSGFLLGNVTQQIINRAASAVLVYKTKD